MRKIERAPVHFQDVDADTGEKLGPPYIKVQNIYVDGIVQLVRSHGKHREAWHCPTDKVWKCHIPVRSIVPPLTFDQFTQELGF